MWTGVLAEHLTSTGITLLVDFESLRRYVTIVAGEMWAITGAIGARTLGVFRPLF